MIPDLESRLDGIMPSGTLFAVSEERLARAGVKGFPVGEPNYELTCVELLWKEATSGRRAVNHRYSHIGGQFRKTRCFACASFESTPLRRLNSRVREGGH